MEHRLLDGVTDRDDSQEFMNSCEYFMGFYLLESDMINVYHFIGLKSYPTDENIEAAYEELRTDEEFGLTELTSPLKHFIATREQMAEDFPEVIDAISAQPTAH